MKPSSGRADAHSCRGITLLAATIFLVLFALSFSKNKSFQTVSITPRTSTANVQENSARLLPTDLPVDIGRRHYATDPHVFPRKAKTLESFLREIKQGLDMHQLLERPVDLIFSDTAYYSDIPHPACSGLWLEFGVYQGQTINKTSLWRERHCGPDAGPIYGFDTFTGLPEDWEGEFTAGRFSLGGQLPPVRKKVELVKGLFSESLPGWMESIKQQHGGEFPPVTYLHIDCDLYAGSMDAFTYLKPYIAPGCVLLFDELLHYPSFREHEIKALWEYLQSSGRKVSVVGVKGPISPEHEDEAVDLDGLYHTQNSWMYQSAAFIVL